MAQAKIARPINYTGMRQLWHRRMAKTLAVGALTLAACEPKLPPRKKEPIPTTATSQQTNTAVTPRPAPAITAKAKAQPKAAGQESSFITWQPAEFYDFKAHDSAWHMASWANGGVFNCRWSPDNVRFTDSFLNLALEKSGSSYVSGEYRTNKEYLYGCFETRMKPALGAGLMAGSFFTYTGTFGQSDHHEIDVEHLGQDGRLVQFDYHTAGKHHPDKRMLDFDATAGFHNYGFKWSQSELVFYVDGQPVKTVTSEIPSKAGKLMINLWPGTHEVSGWLGDYYTGGWQTASYDWVKYSPIEECEAQKPLAQPEPEPEKAAAPAAAALELASMGYNNFSFNGANIDFSGSVFTFTAKGANDPGFGIFVNKPVKGYTSFKFEAQGAANNGMPVVQIYSDKDNDSTPTINVAPFALTPQWSEVTVSIEGRVEFVKKVQYLITSKPGGGRIQLRNLRFE